ncbi:MAG TPA: PIN domain-containing protein [Actinomycetales bacterium]|nr:PIN domain-containing protein [Actinomycetales bacterium]
MAEVFVDTNVLVYAFDTADPVKQRVAQGVLADNPRATISTQVMLEWFQVVTRKLATPLPIHAAAAVLADLATMDVVSADAELVTQAAALVLTENLSVWDAMIVTAASRAGCRTLLSEDLAAGATIAGVTIVNPFT